MTEVRFLPPAAKFILAYTVEPNEDTIIIVVLAGTRENFYDQLKRYIKS